MECMEPKCTGTKTCPRCGEGKNVLAFAVNRGKKDGLRSVCRDCERGEYQARAQAKQARVLRMARWQ